MFSNVSSSFGHEVMAKYTIVQILGFCFIGELVAKIDSFHHMQYLLRAQDATLSSLPLRVLVVRMIGPVCIFMRPWVNILF